ncbi:TonB-dependent receptor [Sphingomonas sp. NPDC079357]|uniref:TonB-dependent receptor n=1 Tax=Sphingomonas sp. NPDC079357 TaxID=3364518 RepID=UPI00384E6994
MKAKIVLQLAGGCAALSIASMAQVARASDLGAVAGQDAQEPAPRTPAASASNEVVVVGLRRSVEKAAEKKKNAKQIVDSIVSEDVGKLPDNNVIDALARVTGVQIDRSFGEGSDLTIRGLSDVQTTLNGNNTNLGSGRALNLADIPSELIKSIDVYKTRSPDQVEGGIGGSVNVELRRPLDFKKGLTVAGSIRGVYSDNPKKVSPFGSLLVSKRFDTGIGEIGLLVNGSYQKNFYRETFVASEGVEQFCCTFRAPDPNAGQIIPQTPRLTLLPTTLRDIAIPYRVPYGLDDGYSKRKSLNVSAQWKPSDGLNFILEGSYFGADNRNQNDGLYLQTRDVRLSNVVLQPDGATVRSATVNAFTPGGTDLPAGFTSNASRSQSYLYTTNAEMNWHTGIARIHVGAQYNWSKSSRYGTQVLPQLRGASSADVDFASDRFNGIGPFISFSGIDLTDVNNYVVDRFQDLRDSNENKEFAAQFDVELAVSDTGLIRRIKTGYRFNHRLPSRSSGYRDGYPRIDGAKVPLFAFPGADAIAPVSALVPGAEALTWLHIPGQTLQNNIDAIRQYIRANDPEDAETWEGDRPPADRGQNFVSEEMISAFYGQIDYRFDIGFPVDGYFGGRLTNTFGSASSTNFRYGPNIPNEPLIETGYGRANYLDFMPSVVAILHFTPKVQLRLSFTRNIERPSFYSTRPSAIIDDYRNPTTVYAGNPTLRPNVSANYDASLEYYFKDGSASLAGFVKKQSGLLFGFERPVSSLSAYGIDGPGLIASEYNTGNGTVVGVESRVESFFRFLPGLLRNFGASLNGTYIPTATQKFPYPDGTPNVPGMDDVDGLSRYTGNAALYYESPKFSTRISYNYRSGYRNGISLYYPQYSPFTLETSRLDGAVNYTPVKFLTLSIEGTNMLRNNTVTYFGKDRLLPTGARLQPRTIQASARFRF